jgi:hypothetical protein
VEEHHIDELARLIATSTSRRQVLKILAGAAVGTLAGSRVAFAKNMTCAQFCQAVFGENTPAEEQCAADAAHHTGLCYSCGPNAPGGGVSPSSVCCTRNSSGFCTSYSGAACCSGGQTCQNGTCVTPCVANGGSCSVDSDCCSGNCNGEFGVCYTCVPDGGACIADSFCCSGYCGDNNVCAEVPF